MLWGSGAQSAEEPVPLPAAASEPAALAPALYLIWLINSDMTPGHRVTPVLDRGTPYCSSGDRVIHSYQRWSTTCSVVLVSVSTPFLSWADQQLCREWTRSFTLIRAKLQGRRGRLLQRGRILVSWARHPHDERPGYGEINRKRPVKQDD